MYDDWKQFLINNGATIDAYGVQYFAPQNQEYTANTAEIAGTAAAAQGNIISDLSHFSLIRARGADAASFLQGQFSNDIRLLNNTSQLTAYCNAQGRMLAIFRVFKHGNDFLLQLPGELREPLLKRLNMFVLRAQVVLENTADTELARIGVSGPEIALKLGHIGPLPEFPNECGINEYQGAQFQLLRLPGIHPRFEIIGPYNQMKALWKHLTSAILPLVTPVGRPAWAWLDIAAGIPTIFPEVSETFVPQMLNLDLIDGINFKKGCYPGQEIVARMHYLGKLKQRMYHAHIVLDSSLPAPRPGDSLYAPDFPEQVAGTVVDAQRAPTGGYDLLAVIQISSAMRGEVHYAQAHGPRLIFKDLPYQAKLSA